MQYYTKLIGGKRTAEQIYQDSRYCFTLRDLNLGVITHPILVRRDSDALDRDFTFSEIVDGTLENWVKDGRSIGEGIVRVWRCSITGQSISPRSSTSFNYTQNGRSLPARIVVNGQLQLLNGKPFLKRTVPDAGYKINYYVPNGGNRHMFAVIKRPDFPKSVMFGQQTGGYSLFYADQTSNPTHTNATVYDVRLNSVDTTIDTRLESYNSLANHSLLNFKFNTNWVTNYDFSLAASTQNGPSGRGMYSMQEWILFQNILTPSSAIVVEEDQKLYYGL